MTLPHSRISPSGPCRVKRSRGSPIHSLTSTDREIELGEDFFNEIIRCPIPIDLNTLRAMKRSPLGLDLYLWLTYRTFGLKRPLRLTWPLLYRQFGVDPSTVTTGDRESGRRCPARRSTSLLSVATPRGWLSRVGPVFTGVNVDASPSPMGHGL